MAQRLRQLNFEDELKLAIDGHEAEVSELLQRYFPAGHTIKLLLARSHHRR